MAVFIASKGFAVKLVYNSPTKGSTTIPGYDTPFAVGLSRGMIIVHVSRRFWACEGSWEFSASSLVPSQPFFSWPGSTVPKGFDIFPHVFRGPLWIPALLVAIPSLLLWRRNRKLPKYYCECGYNLTGNVSGVCPECGKKLHENIDSRENDEYVSTKIPTAEEDGSACR